VRVVGHEVDELDRLGEKFEAQVATELRMTLITVSRRGDVRNVHRLNAIHDVWSARVGTTLLPFVRDVWWGSASNIWRHHTGRALTAAVEPVPVTNGQVEVFLATARNRLSGISDDAWKAARASLLEGVSLGESIPVLRQRIVRTATIVEPRAQVIARTEVHNASSHGSLTQVRGLGVTGVTKEWVAATDARTRDSHHAANGQRVGVNDMFSVGGSFMDRPGDGPPRETVNCRCVMTYDVPED